MQDFLRKMKPDKFLTHWPAGKVQFVSTLTHPRIGFDWLFRLLKQTDSVDHACNNLTIIDAGLSYCFVIN